MSVSSSEDGNNNGACHKVTVVKFGRLNPYRGLRTMPSTQKILHNNYKHDYTYIIFVNYNNFTIMHKIINVYVYNIYVYCKFIKYIGVYIWNLDIHTIILFILYGIINTIITIILMHLLLSPPLP